MDPLRPPLTKRLQPRHWVAIDYVFAALMVLVTVAGAHGHTPLHGLPHAAGDVIAATGALPAAFRRRWPRAVLALVVAGAAATAAIGVGNGPSLPVAFVMYMIALRLPRQSALWLLSSTLLVVAAAYLAAAVTQHDIARQIGPAAAATLGSGVFITAAWMIGYAVRQQRAYTAGLREQAERRAQEQVAQARRAISEERLRIARELHDVVAHSMSLIAVQAGVANYVVGTRPEEAARALSSIEETSRGALREMRTLLGLLRADDSTATGQQQGPREAGLAPAPGLADLDRLVARTAEAGVRVDLEVRGERAELSAGVDLAAYRVVQEALTNVIKHAAVGACQVILAYEEDALSLEVTDNGRGGAAPGRAAVPDPAGGHGIVGMRERVGIYGGEFRAGPLPGHGFRVSVRLPLASPAT